MGPSPSRLGRNTSRLPLGHATAYYAPTGHLLGITIPPSRDFIAAKFLWPVERARYSAMFHIAVRMIFTGAAA